jgi:hypothetical protein
MPKGTADSSENAGGTHDGLQHGEGTSEERTAIAMIEADDWRTASKSSTNVRRPISRTHSPQGAVKALVRLRPEPEERGADAFEVEDLPWENELADFAATLRDAGIKARSW